VYASLGLEPARTARDAPSRRPPDVVGAAFAPYVALNDDAHRPLSAEGRRPRFIVLHTMQNTLPVIFEYFRKPTTKVGAHYLVDSVAGTTVQMADERLVVFHDACFNEESVGSSTRATSRPAGSGTARSSTGRRRGSYATIAQRHGIPLDRSHILGHGGPDCSDHTDPGRGGLGSVHELRARRVEGRVSVVSRGVRARTPPDDPVGEAAFVREHLRELERSRTARRRVGPDRLRQPRRATASSPAARRVPARRRMLPDRSSETTS
jgi:hypothetical protein